MLHTLIIQKLICDMRRYFFFAVDETISITSVLMYSVLEPGFLRMSCLFYSVTYQFDEICYF